MARIDEVTIVWKTDTTQLDKAKASFSEVDKTVKQSEKSTTSFTQTANKQFSGLNSTIKTIGATIAAAFAVQQVIGFVGSIVNLGKEFTSVMSRVQALTQATEEEFAVLEARAKELGATTQFSASQAAEAMVFLAQAGFNTKQIFDALPGTLQLAAAGQLDLATAADIASNVLSGYGLQAEELNRVNDLIVATTSKANTNVVQFAEAFKVAGPIAKSAGVSIEEVSSIIGTLANSGIQASLGGTALRGTISSLISPSAAAAKELKALGITTKDASGNLLPLNEIFQQLKDANVDTAQLFTIFGERAASAASVLTAAGTSVGDFADVLGNSVGIAAKIASEQMDNLTGDGLALSSAFEGRVLQVFEAFEPILRAVTRALTFVISNIGTFIKIAGIAAVATTAYSLATGGLAAVKLTLTNVLRSARTAMIAFNVAMAANPVGLIAAGIAAAATALIVFRKELAASVGGTKQLTDAQQSFLDTTAKEEAQLKTLFDALKTANKGSEQRKVAIQEINKAYGAYLPNMLTEESTAQDIEEAYKLINEQLINKIALQLREQEITAANTVFIEKQRFAFRELTSLQIAAINDVIKAYGLLEDGAKLPSFSILSDAAKQAGVDVGTFTARIITVIDAQKELNTSLGSTNAFFDQYISDLKESVIETTDLETETTNTSDALDILKKRIEALGKELLLQSLNGKINNATLQEYKTLTAQLAAAQYMLSEAIKGTNDWLTKQSDILADETVKGTSSAIDQFNYLEAEVKKVYNELLIAAIGNTQATTALEKELTVELLKIQKERLQFELGLLTEGTLQYNNKRVEILEAERKIQQELTVITAQGAAERNRILGESDRERDIAAFENAKQQAEREIEVRKQVTDGSLNLALELSGALQEISRRRVAFEDNLIQDQLERGIITEKEAAAQRKEIQLQEAQRAKSFAVFDILLNTARAVISALASTPPNPVLAAFSAATGAVQLGIAASTPLPFAEGVVDLKAKGQKGVDSVHALLAPGESVMTSKETEKYKPALLAMRNGIFEKEFMPMKTIRPEFAVKTEDGGSQMSTNEMEYLLNKVWRSNEQGAEKIATAVTKSMNKTKGKRYFI